jgi:O-antigen ligase
MTFALYVLLIALTYLRPVEAFAPELAEYRIVLVLMLLALAASIFEATGLKATAVRGRHLKLLAAFMCVIAFSLVANGWSGGAIPAVVDFAPAAVLFILTLLNVRSMARLRVACAVLVACLVVLSAASAVAYHTGFMANDLVLRQNSDNDEGGDPPEEGVIPADDTSGAIFWRVRSFGFLRDPNDFSQALVSVLPLLAAAYRRRAPLRNLTLLGIPAAILFYGIYLTHSRGALLGIGTLVFLGLYRRFGLMRTGVIMVALAVAAAGANFTGGRAITTQEESASGRIDAWSDGLNMLKAQPVFGVGYHNFTEHHDLTAHNSFVLCFSELGLVGYWIWLGLLVLIIRETSQVADNAPLSDERAWANLLRTSLLGFMTCAWFLSRTYEPGLFILLALCISSVHCAQLHSTNEWAAVHRPVPWRMVTTFVTIGSIGLVYLVVLLQNAYGR